MKRYLKIILSGLALSLVMITGLAWEVSHHVREFSQDVTVLDQVAPKRAGTSIAMPLPRLDAVTPEAWSTAAEKSGTESQTEVLRAATDFLEAHREEWELREYHEFHPEVFQDPLVTTVKFRVTQDGVPIQGQEIVLEVDSQKNVQLAKKEYRPLAKAEGEESPMVLGDVLQKNSREFVTSATADDLKSKVFVVLEGTDEPVLTYGVSGHERSGAQRPVYVLFRASDGQPVARSYSRVEFK